MESNTTPSATAAGKAGDTGGRVRPVGGAASTITRCPADRGAVAPDEEPEGRRVCAGHVERRGRPSPCSATQRHAMRADPRPPRDGEAPAMPSSASARAQRRIRPAGSRGGPGIAGRRRRRGSASPSPPRPSQEPGPTRAAPGASTARQRSERPATPGRRPSRGPGCSGPVPGALGRAALATPAHSASGLRRRPLCNGHGAPARRMTCGGLSGGVGGDVRGRRRRFMDAPGSGGQARRRASATVEPPRPQMRGPQAGRRRARRAARVSRMPDRVARGARESPSVA